jgi:hypothetical protein
MLPQVLGAAWGKDGSELGQLAGCVGICCALPKMGDSERVMCSGSRVTAERRVASLRRLGWDAWMARCKGNASSMRAVVGRLMTLVGWVHGRAVFLVDSRNDKYDLWARWYAPAGGVRVVMSKWSSRSSRSSESESVPKAEGKWDEYGVR